MRILHTSDWHIGRNLHNNILKPEFELFISWLKRTIEEQNIDILLIAGDIFDVAFPSSTAQSMYYQALADLIKTPLKKVIILAGNHDSVSHLKAPSHILKALNVEIFAGLDDLDKLIYPFPENEPQLVFAAVPYIRQFDLLRLNQNIDSSSQIRFNIAQIYNILYEKTEPYRKQGLPIVATGHLFVTDGSFDAQDQEEYSLGGLVDIPARHLPNFDYIALGHVHRPMRIGNTNIYYSGNPFLMGFNDIRKPHHKRVIIYDTETREITSVQVPLLRQFVKFEGALDQIIEQLRSFRTTGQLQPAFASVVVTEYPDTYAQTVADKIRSIKNPQISVIDLKILPKFDQLQATIDEQRSLKEISEIEIFKTILKQQNIEKQKYNQLLETFMQLLEALKQQE